MKHLLALLPLATFSSCATDPVSGRTEFSVVRWSIEEELEIGERTAPSLVAQMDGPYADAQVQADLRELVAEMVSHSPRADEFKFEFVLLNSSIPNALALPGGRVFLTRGLLAKLGSEAEFVAVLGHELGHVEHRHAMKRLSDGILLGLPQAPLRVVADTLPFGGSLFGSVADVVSAPTTLLGLSFSRGQELEADERGVFFPSAMGYDPRAMVGALETINALEQEADGDGPSSLSILRTHPPGPDRIRCIEAESAKFEDPDRVPRPDSPAFAAILEHFRTVAPVYDEHERALDALQELLANPDLGETEQQELFQQITDSLGSALAQLPTEPLFHITAGELAMMVGEFERAFEFLELAESTYARETPAWPHWKPPYYIGLLQSAAGEHSLAVEALGVALQRYPESAQIRDALETVRAAAEDPGSPPAEETEQRTEPTP